MTIHGCHNTPEYHAWEQMLGRCLNKNHPKFSRYGGRGISVCDNWRSFIGFIQDMGFREDGLQLDRIDNDGNYESGNCRWTTRKVQQNNTSFNRVIEFKGVTRTLSQWGDFLGIKPNTILTRIRRGWSIDKALGKKVNVA